MKIEVRGYKGFAGRDGECFTASLYFDGVRSCKVSNGGTGGPNDYEWVGRYAGGLDALTWENRRDELAEQADAYGKTIGLDNYGEIADLYVEKLIEEGQTAATINANAKRGYPVTAVFYGANGGTVAQWALRGVPKTDDARLLKAQAEVNAVKFEIVDTRVTA